MSRRLFPAALVSLLLLSLASFGSMSIVDRGTWPDTWPKELEPYRHLAITLGIATGIQEQQYVIPFSTSGEFEAVWPHILKVRSPKAPIILERSPWKQGYNYVKAGVRVLGPDTGGGVSMRTGEPLLIVGPPWPKEIENEGGELPEYVTKAGGKWVPCTREAHKGVASFLFRARTDIVLIVDDNIVDLKRITMPEDAKVIDKRVEEKEVEKPTK